MRTIEQLVAAEVHYCVSALVSTLAQSGIAFIPSHELGPDIRDAAEQALELASPIPDYEEAAIQEGWSLFHDRMAGMFRCVRNDAATDDDVTVYCQTATEAWEQACQDSDIDPRDDGHEREVFEHWIVSDWLADRLAEQGEKVDKDFCGLTVWARTTTGQGIASDSVIGRIHAALMTA